MTYLLRAHFITAELQLRKRIHHEQSCRLNLNRTTLHHLPHFHNPLYMPVKSVLRDHSRPRWALARAACEKDDTTLMAQILSEIWYAGHRYSRAYLVTAGSRCGSHSHFSSCGRFRLSQIYAICRRMDRTAGWGGIKAGVVVATVVYYRRIPPLADTFQGPTTLSNSFRKGGLAKQVMWDKKIHILEKLGSLHVSP